MPKLRPFIAAIMLGIVVGFAIWLTYVIGKNLFYNPVEKVDISRLPDTATRKEHQQFSEMQKPGDYRKIQTGETIIAKPGSNLRDTSLFENAKQDESAYQLRAQTQSAFDPLKDEILRSKLWELIRMKEQFEKELHGKAGQIYDDLSVKADNELFKSNLFKELASLTIEAGMNQPDSYPLKQAEVKRDFYMSLMNLAESNLDKFNKDFNDAMAVELEGLRSDQQDQLSLKVNEIRDYLVKKTELLHNGAKGIED
jgi:hypothetical protein